MSAGSLQLRLYRIARRDGLSAPEAAAVARISAREAALVDKDDQRDPPPAGAFLLSPGMARAAVGGLSELPIGAAAVTRLSGGTA